MESTPSEIERVLALLAETPSRIASITNDVVKALLHTGPGEDAWSVHEVVAHLRACADVWGNSILAMVAQDHPTLKYVSPRTWIRKTDYPEQEFQISFYLIGSIKLLILPSL